MKRKAKNNYIFWRLIYDGSIAPSEVFSMDEEMILEADAALDLYIEEIKKAKKKGGGKRG